MTSPEARKSRRTRSRLLGDQGGGVAVADGVPGVAGALLRRNGPGRDVGVRQQHRTCTSSCTMPATCSASPATDAAGVADTMEKQIIGRGLAGRRPRWSARVRLCPDLRRTRHRPGDRLRGRRRRSPRGHARRWPRARCRGVHPRRAGQHRHGFRRAGVQRRDGRVVRGGVRGGLRPRRQCLGTPAVAVCGGRNVVEPVRRSRAEVPGQPACRQPRRDDPAAHAALPADGRAVGGAVRRCGLPGSATRGAAGRMERHAGRRPARTSSRSPS